MRRNLLAAALALFLIAPAAANAADPLPGSACSSAGAFMPTGGAESGGAGNLMVCNGGVWKSFLGYDATGQVTKLGNQTCNTNEFLKFDGTKWICTANTLPTCSNLNTLLYYNSSWVCSSTQLDVTSNTELLIHANGTDASTSFPDSSANAYTVTAVAQAQVDTAQSKFGGASLLCDGSLDRLTIPDNADFEFGAGDFTIDLWVRFNALPTDGTYKVFVQKGWATVGNYSWFFGATSTGGVQEMLFTYTTDGSASQENKVGWSPVTGTWYHVAAIRQASTLNIYVNGVALATFLVNSNFYNSALGPTICSDSSGTNSLNGWIDEVRIVKGAPGWLDNFTPPTAAY